MGMMLEEDVWKTADPDDLWVMDKLILSRKLGYRCGPVGLNVPEPGYYIVRPCVNMMGLGLGAEKIYIRDNTDHLPVGFFWCDFFIGRHLSVDYHKGLQMLCVEGSKPKETFTHWDKWERTNDYVPMPEIIKPFIDKYDWINCEFIDGKLIEVHFRRNKDFDKDTRVFIPVWEGLSTEPPEGFRYIDYPDVHGRIGAFIR